MTKICCISDIHGNLPEDLPESDLLIIAGDICPTINHQLWFQEAWIESSFKTWLKSVPAKEKVFIFGNHDYIGQKNPEKIRKIFENCIDVHYLQDSHVNLFDLNIWGTPWQPYFYDWAFNLFEAELAEKWEYIPDNTDILVVHGPPQGYGDLTRSGEHTGSPSLLKKIEDIKPKLTVCGHIHPAYGRYSINDTIVVNASLLNERYKLVNKPFVLEL